MTTHDLPSFDIRHVPFSRRGAWLGVSPVVAPHRTHRLLHLVSHRTGMHAVLSFTPLAEGAAVDAVVHADPSQLVWDLPGGGVVRAAFEADGALRIRGTAGTGLVLADAASELTPFTGVYLFRDPLDGSAVFTSYETGCRYRITPVTARLEVEGAEALGSAERRVSVQGSEDWEIVVEEFDTARPPYAHTAGFDEVVAATRREFVEYLDAVAPWRSDRAPAAALAGYVMWAATVSPAGFLRRESVLMSKHWMDKVWSWDHCFNALALTPGLPEAAWDQFLAPFDHQDAAGALPDSIAHSERLYNFVKPPIHGWALQRMRRAGLVLDAERLRVAYERLSTWTGFWLTSRRRHGSPLPSYQHGNDSGWDNATLFDRDRVVEAPDLVAFLLLQLDALIDLAAELGEDTTGWQSTADQLRSAWTDRLWHDDGFAARGVWSDEDSKRTSLLTLIPLVASTHLGREAVDVLAADVHRFLTPWGLATETVDSPDYESDGYWRGPIWAPSTLLIEDGLRTGGHTDLADEVSARFRRLCEASGFAENFDALSGEGLRDRAYTWTAAVYLILARDATS